MLNGLEHRLGNGVPGFGSGLGIGQDKEKGGLPAERLKLDFSAAELYLRQSELKDKEGNLLEQGLEVGLYSSEFHLDYQKYTNAAKELQQAEGAKAAAPALEAEDGKKGPGRLPPVRDGFTVERSDYVVQASEGFRTYVADNLKPDDIITVENLDTGELASFRIDKKGGLHMMDEPVTEGKNVMNYKLHEGDVLNIVTGNGVPAGGPSRPGGPNDFYVDSFDEGDVVGIENLDTGQKTYFRMDDKGILHQLVNQELDRVNELMKQGEDIITYKARTGDRVHIRGEGENDDTLVTLNKNGFTIEPEEEAKDLPAPAEGEGEDVSVVKAKGEEEDQGKKELDFKGIADALKQRMIDVLLGRDVEKYEIIGLKDLEAEKETASVEEAVAGEEIEDIDNSKGADGRTVLEVADTINSFIGDMYELYKGKYGEGSEELNDFVETMKGAVDEGISQARDELQALGALDGLTDKRIDRIQELVHEGIDKLYEEEMAKLEGEVAKAGVVLPEQKEEGAKALDLKQIDQAQLAANQHGANYLGGAGFEPPRDYTAFDYRV